MKTNQIITILLTIALFAACKNESKEKENTKTENTVSADFNKMLDNYYQEGLKLNPLNATFSGDTRYNDSFPNFLSDEYTSQLKTFYTNYKEEASKFDDSTLSETEKMSKDILLWECNINLETLTFKNSTYFPIDQMWTVNLMMGQLASGSSAQPFKTVEDYNNWLKRLDGYVVWLNSAETRMKEGMAAGYVLPKSLIVKVIPQLKAMTEPNLNKNLFNSPVKNFPDNFSDEDKNQLTEAYSKMVSEKIIPAYQNLHDFMAGDYLNAGRTTTGIADTPSGEAYYKHQIKQYTTTEMTADEIHRLGLSEVARISSEMEKVKEQIGFKGDLKAFFNFVRTNEKLMPYKEPQQIIDHFYAIYDTMKPKLEVLFDHKPKTTFEVKQTEKFRESSASAEYNPGSLDGTRPGVFYVPIPNASEYNIYSDESLFLHEAIPGHHYQISLTQENDELPMFRKTLFYSGYGEGWALYSESLGKELGLYTDPYQYFGMLDAEMHRAVRLVVDTGMHSKGWTREQAIRYCLENEAEPEAGIVSEIERYMANPGQALAYKIGQLKILELRHKAEKELGDKFKIGEFHNQVLETGCIPLQLLENKINLWIANTK
ncbi:hypothetical protein Aeqsu_0260 [Aequorivita sublithincola DSM 14238]|uniref:DUF885 domain-containing protein n=1 Tax=Aequorivita sublithincola (strain DSM 14238 / LMG 21431 / ACAM 643 / 9-3) TaxID=746697 RepID=I3YS13_AEQSU|nr:DUF885 domain-containing protein [Aequorivita sublithincola]AFL79781.1 hypothetical protein Aeqsu_0260 [Aequorivita sublithincola DSM 14238]